LDPSELLLVENLYVTHDGQRSVLELIQASVERTTDWRDTDIVIEVQRPLAGDLSEQFSQLGPGELVAIPVDRS
jgi:hypothetical protein